MGAFLRFLAERRPIYLLTEANVYSRSRQYAGRTDAFMKVKVPDEWRPPEGSGVRWPLLEPGWLSLCTDYKAGKAIYHEVTVQTAAYRNGDFVGGPDRVTELAVPPVDGCAVLHLRANGTYGFELLRSDDLPFRVFLYAREIFAWVQRESRVGTRTWTAGEIPIDAIDAFAASLEQLGQPVAV
jgi:hypothetical protein